MTRAARSCKRMVGGGPGAVRGGGGCRNGAARVVARVGRRMVVAERGGAGAGREGAAPVVVGEVEKGSMGEKVGGARGEGEDEVVEIGRAHV